MSPDHQLLDDDIRCPECGSVEVCDCEPVDKYGNPLSGDRTINCCFPDCGCDGARLCQAENGASGASRAINIEHRSLPMLTNKD